MNDLGVTRNRLSLRSNISIQSATACRFRTPTCNAGVRCLSTHAVTINNNKCIFECLVDVPDTSDMFVDVNIVGNLTGHLICIYESIHDFHWNCF